MESGQLDELSQVFNAIVGYVVAAQAKIHQLFHFAQMSQPCIRDVRLADWQMLEAPELSDLIQAVIADSRSIQIEPFELLQIV